MENPSTRSPRPIPATIGLVFGGLWFWLGATALPPVWRTLAGLAGALITLGLIVRLWRAPGPEDTGAGMFKRGAYFVAVALEVAAIYTASALLPKYGLQGYFIQAVGVIVGLHFIGLWRATGLARFLWIAGAMCAVSLLATLLPAAWEGVDPRDAATGIGNALVLWIGAGRPIGRAP
jgi:hypothetical protein